MSNTLSALPLLPLVISLAGAGILWLLPLGRVGGRIRRWLFVSVLLAILLSLALAILGGPRPARLPESTARLLYEEPLAFSYDALALHYSLLLVGALAVVVVSGVSRSLERFEAVSLLLLAAAGIATCAAANLFTLCLAWGLLDIALLGFEVTRTPEQGLRRSTRQVFGNMVSSLSLIAATVLIASTYDDTRYAHIVPLGTPLYLLMLAATMRLGAFPFPGSYKLRWQSHVASICTGGCLWLRIGSMSPQGMGGAPVLQGFGGGLMLVTALLAALAPSFTSALPYILLSGISLAILSPLINPSMGLSTAFLATINLILGLALLQAGDQVWPRTSLGRWSRLPLGIALASLGGWPLTLGAVVWWRFLASCWMQDLRGLYLVGALAYLLISIPLWRRVLALIRGQQSGPGEVNWRYAVAIASAFAVSALYVVIGLHPALLQNALNRSLSTQLPSIGSLFSSAPRLIGLIVVTVLVGPVGGAYLLSAGPVIAPERRGPRQILELIGRALDLDWLYQVWEEGFGRFSDAVGRWLVAAEESLHLVWVLSWALAVAMYLVER